MYFGVNSDIHNREGTLTVTWTNSKVKVWAYEPIDEEDPESEWHYVQKSSGWTQDVELINHAYGSGWGVSAWAEGIAPSSATDDVIFTATFTPTDENGGSAVTDVAKLTVIRADVDVDSKNDNGFAVPADNAEEDRIEDVFDDPQKPSKIIGVNDDDSDGDDVLDYNDGFDLDGAPDNPTSGGDNSSASDRFVPVRIDFGPVDRDTARVSFSYPGWDPFLGFTGPTNTGYIRLWTKDGNQVRDGHGALESGQAGTGGHYIRPGAYYDLADLAPPGSTSVTLYAEAITPSQKAGDVRVVASLDPDGVDGIAGFMVADAARMTAQKLEVRWVAKNDAFGVSPLDTNPHLNGGLRIFPDKRSPNDAVVRDLVDVEVKITPALTGGRSVYLQSFDVDDPNAFVPGLPVGGDDQIDEYDTATTAPGSDNRGENPRGWFVGTSQNNEWVATTDEAGVARASFVVAKQPGDNFRIAAALSSTELNKLSEDGSGGTTQVSADNKQPAGGFDGKVTDMLTVWRHLWVERDVMTGVTPNTTAVTIVGVIPNVAQSGTGGANDIVQLAGELPDGQDAFEGGVLTIAGFGVGGKYIPIYLNSEGGVAGGGDTINVPANSFTPAELAAINGGGGVTASVHDDDVIPAGGTHALPDGGTLLQSAFGDAYILPRYVDP